MAMTSATTTVDLVGAQVQFRTVFDEQVNGTILAIDQQAQLLAIQQQPGLEDSSDGASQTIIHTNYIKQIDSVRPKVQENGEANGNAPHSVTGSISQEQVAENQKTSLDLLEKEEEGINYAASREAQALYNHLSKVFGDVAWDGKEIVLLKGEVRITDPYNARHVKHSKGGARKSDQPENDEREVEEVRRIVERIREKLGLQP